MLFILTNKDWFSFVFLQLTTLQEKQHPQCALGVTSLNIYLDNSSHLSHHLSMYTAGVLY